MTITKEKIEDLTKEFGKESNDTGATGTNNKLDSTHWNQRTGTQQIGTNGVEPTSWNLQTGIQRIGTNRPESINWKQQVGTSKLEPTN